MRSLWNDESGFIVCSELVLVVTLLVIGLVVGLTEIRNSVSHELNDVGNAIGSANQTYRYSGLSNANHYNRRHRNGCVSYVAGSAFTDYTDGSDGDGSTDFTCHVPQRERVR